MKNTHNDLLLALNINNEKVVSRSHLPILLKKVNGKEFSRLVFHCFGVCLNPKMQEWFGIDGKELRGRILAGNTRGEAVVPVVRHSDMAVLIQDYYNGSKDSEQPTIVSLLETTGVSSQKVSMDALHFTPKPLKVVAGGGGHYLVGLKENQPHYQCWNIEDQYLDKRWKEANLCTLITVTRSRFENKREKFSQETSLYMSNIKVKTTAIAKDLFDASRGHWVSEVYNNIRDTTLAEDKLKTISKDVSINLSILRTLVISVLNKIKPINMAALLDDFSDDFQLLIASLKSVKVL